MKKKKRAKKRKEEVMNGRMGQAETAVGEKKKRRRRKTSSDKHEIGDAICQRQLQKSIIRKLTIGITHIDCPSHEAIVCSDSFFFLFV